MSTRFVATDRGLGREIAHGEIPQGSSLMVQRGYISISRSRFFTLGSISIPLDTTSIYLEVFPGDLTQAVPVEALELATA